MDFNPKPYLFRGKAHSVRTLHTALARAAGLPPGELGAMSFSRDEAVIRTRDGREFTWARWIDGATRLSHIEER